MSDGELIQSVIQVLRRNRKRLIRGRKGDAYARRIDNACHPDNVGRLTIRDAERLIVLTSRRIVRCIAEWMLDDQIAHSNLLSWLHHPARPPFSWGYGGSDESVLDDLILLLRRRPTLSVN